MDISELAKQIKLLSIEKRIRIVQEILESIAEEQTTPDLTAAKKGKLTAELQIMMLIQIM
ncbi:MAG TPA: addiction module protein [Nostocaceae cyanobacterium]|nr:addiction module protein [Nostocaceae cyanobacterium]